MPNFQPITEPFSAHYEIVHNADVRTYGDEEAIMDYEMFAALKERFGLPLVGLVGGLHYQFKPETTIPQASLAIPDTNHSDPSTFLIQR